MLSALTRARPQAATASPQALAARLAGQTPDQRLATLTALVTAATATVLAHPDPAALDPDRPFKDLGIDSLTALELRNTFDPHTGLTLPATLIFDHPTPTALATHLARPAHRAPPRPQPQGHRGRGAHVDEPVAVVGMACRFPGGVDSAAGVVGSGPRRHRRGGRIPD